MTRACFGTVFGKLVARVFVTVLACYAPTCLQSQTIATGGRHSLAICADSTVRSWGFNAYGQLGSGTLNPEHSAVRVEGLSSITYVAGGLFHSLFVQRDGTVWACGRNTLGPLGDGTSADKTIPVQVVGLTGIAQASGGGEHSLFLKDDGTVWGCGANSSGQLGDGTVVNRLSVVQTTGLNNIVQVAAGAEFSLFLTASGQVWACGHNGFGQYGNGTTNSVRTPTLVSGLSDVVHISAGEWHSLFVLRDGSVFASGRNNYGQLGDGSLIDRRTATRVLDANDVVSADAGGIHSVFVQRDGTVLSCGLNSGGNNNGQLGDGTAVDRSVPVPVRSSWGAEKIRVVQAAREHTIYMATNHQVWSSGRNNYGQLGNGASTNENALTPVLASTVCSTLRVSVLDPVTETRPSLYPNPFATHTNLQLTTPLLDATLTVFNVLGNQVHQSKGHTGSTIVFHRSNLPCGFYTVHVAEYERQVASYSALITD